MQKNTMVNLILVILCIGVFLGILVISKKPPAPDNSNYQVQQSTNTSQNFTHVKGKEPEPGEIQETDIKPGETTEEDTTEPIDVAGLKRVQDPNNDRFRAIKGFIIGFIVCIIIYIVYTLYIQKQNIQQKSQYLMEEENIRNEDKEKEEKENIETSEETKE